MTTMQTLTQPPTAVASWDVAVTDAVGDALQACRSDAQAIVEGQPEAMAMACRQMLDPQASAVLVIEAATAGRTPAGAQV